MEGTWESWRLSRTGVGKRWPRIKTHVRNTLEILSDHSEWFCQMTGADDGLALEDASNRHVRKHIGEPES